MDKILLGTSKGLVVIDKINNKWNVSDVQFIGFPVSMLFTDHLSGKWWVALDHKHWGPKIHCSDDEGKNWYESNVPNFNGYENSENQQIILKKIWVMEGAGKDYPGCYWLGTEPGGLFYTENDGKTFQLVESLWNHPSRSDESQWFGAGRDYPFIHSIVVDPRDSNKIKVAVSCAGVFASDDMGKSWEVRNNGLNAGYLPNPDAEVGHDPHMMLACSANPDVIWQQNHCGIYKTTDQGQHWVNKSGVNGFPYYGFALAVDENNPKEAWVIPAKSDEVRVAAGLKMVVCYTKDGGDSWREITDGLPSYPAFGIVLRQSFDKAGDLMAFGTNNGNLFISENKGNNWLRLSGDLPTINCIKIIQVLS